MEQLSNNQDLVTIKIDNDYLDLSKGSYIHSSVSSDIDYFVREYLEENGISELDDDTIATICGIVGYRDITKLQTKCAKYLADMYRKLLAKCITEHHPFTIVEDIQGTEHVEGDNTLCFTICFQSKDDKAPNLGDITNLANRVLAPFNGSNFHDFTAQANIHFWDEFDSCFFVESSDLVYIAPSDSLTTFVSELRGNDYNVTLDALLRLQGKLLANADKGAVTI